MVSIAIGTVQRGPLERESEPEQIAAREAKEWEPRPLPEKETGVPNFAPGGKDDVIANLQKYRAEHRATPKIEPLKELPPRLRPPVPSGLEKFLHGINEQVRKGAAKEREEAERLTKMLAPTPGAIAESLRQITSSSLPQPETGTSRSGAPGPLPVLLLLDEFGTIGKLAAVSRAYGLMAGLGMVLWIFVQDLNQLKRFYEEEWETFIGNVNAMVCFGVMDQFTCEYISEMMGMKTVRYQTSSKQKGSSTKIRQATFDDAFLRLLGGAPPNLEEASGTTESESTTDHVVAQRLCSADVIRTSPPAMMFVIGRDDPAICQRVSYYRDPQFSSWARPDPRYAKR